MIETPTSFDKLVSVDERVSVRRAVLGDGAPPFFTYPFAYIIVYVHVDQNQLVDQRVDFHQSLGGQARVICSCNRYPLIATGRRRELRRVCMTDGCTKKESHICSNPKCSSRLCQKCLLLYPEDGMLAIDPPLQDDIENGHTA